MTESADTSEIPTAAAACDTPIPAVPSVEDPAKEFSEEARRCPEEPASTSRFRIVTGAVARCVAWTRRERVQPQAIVAPAETPSRANTRQWVGFGGAGFWNIQTLRTFLFLGSLAITFVSALALFHGLHQARISQLANESVEFTELPSEQFQPKIAGSLPAPAATAVTHPLLAPPPPSPIPPAPTLPVVVTADASNPSAGVAPTGGNTSPPANPTPVATPASPPAAPAIQHPPPTPPAVPATPAPPPASGNGAGLEGGIEDEDAPAPIIIRANGTSAR